MTDIEPLIHEFLAAMTAGDVEAVRALIADDVVFEHYTGGARTTRAEGKAAFEELAKGSAEAFASRGWEIRRITKGDGCATFETTMQGVPAADLPNGMKQGVPIALDGVTVYEARDGKITRMSDYG
jgi:steroid delta-isomerase-like uncharacterized protein